MPPATALHLGRLMHRVESRAAARRRRLNRRSSAAARAGDLAAVRRLLLDGHAIEGDRGDRDTPLAARLHKRCAGRGANSNRRGLLGGRCPEPATKCRRNGAARCRRARPARHRRAADRNGALEWQGNRKVVRRSPRRNEHKRRRKDRHRRTSRSPGDPRSRVPRRRGGDPARRRWRTGAPSRCRATYAARTHRRARELSRDDSPEVFPRSKVAWFIATTRG